MKLIPQCLKDVADIASSYTSAAVEQARAEGDIEYVEDQLANMKRAKKAMKRLWEAANSDLTYRNLIRKNERLNDQLKLAVKSFGPLADLKVEADHADEDIKA